MDKEMVEIHARNAPRARNAKLEYESILQMKSTAAQLLTPARIIVTKECETDGRT